MVKKMIKIIVQKWNIIVYLNQQTGKICGSGSKLCL